MFVVVVFVCLFVFACLFVCFVFVIVRLNAHVQTQLAYNIGFKFMLVVRFSWFANLWLCYLPLQFMLPNVLQSIIMYF